MGNIKNDIEAHYFKAGLYEDIEERLLSLGKNLDEIGREDIAAVDEIHVRGAAVSKELAATVDLNGMHILDMGCGLGGPCRMLADTYDCRATGIDLSHEYVRTATALSKLVKLDHLTTFVQGDATELPFENASFDMVWTQHVQMNIMDKRKFYSEVNRVLKPSGHFMYYDIFGTGNGPVSYPMPWATEASQSFLFSPVEMDEILRELGLSNVTRKDETREGLEFFKALMEQMREFGPPTLGLNVLMGTSTQLKLMNLFSHLSNGALCLESGVYGKG